LQAPYSAQLSLDRRRARAQLFPALDPSACLSSVLTFEAVGQRHVDLARTARDGLLGYAQLDPGFERIDIAEQPEVAGCFPTLLRYLSQPFLVAEPFPGRPGAWVRRTQLLDEVEALLVARVDGESG
jgi:F0F1-type ATP synthase beta subunit